MRGAFDALFEIDDAMGTVVATATQPTLAAIKLVWWRDALEALDSAEPPAEPRLRAAAAELLPRGISGTDLALLEQSWSLFLDPDDVEAFKRGVEARGRTLFALAARLLGVPMNEEIENAAHAFVAVDLARRGITDLRPLQIPRSRTGAARPDRPLTAFHAIARRDMRTGGPPFEAEATPARAWALLKHRMIGR